MIVVITDEALEDLRDIRNFISGESPAQAERVVDQLLAASETIADSPLAWSYVPRRESSGVRRRVIGNYLVFYRIAAARIDVLHILHGARDYDAIIFPDTAG